MTNQTGSQYNSGPAYKQPWFWLIMAPLITTIIVGTSMLVYSIIAYDGRTVDQYKKDGFNVTQSFEREQKAQSLNLKATAVLNANQLEINVESNLNALPAMLQLIIFSPASKSQDVKIDLILDNDVYRATVDLKGLSKRTMHIVDPNDKSWLIQTKQAWPFTKSVHFTPYLTAY